MVPNMPPTSIPPTSPGPSGGQMGDSRAPGQAGARQGSYGQAGSVGMSTTTDKAREAIDSARAEAGDFVARQRGQLSDRIDAFRQAVDDRAERLEHDGSMAAAPARKLSQGLGSLAYALEAGDMEDLGHRLKNFARRNPGLFIGGAMALGFLAGRFIKSSGQHSHE